MVCSPTHSSVNLGLKTCNLQQFAALRIYFSVRFWERQLRFAPFCLSILLANSYFFKPKNQLLAPKKLLFKGYFALSSQ